MPSAITDKLSLYWRKDETLCLTLSVAIKKRSKWKRYKDFWTFQYIICCRFFNHMFYKGVDFFNFKEISVRWNSSLIMARRLCEQKEAIEEYAFQYWRNQRSQAGRCQVDGQAEASTLELGNEEWLILSELVSILEACEDISKLFCKHYISSVIPYSSSLKKVLSNISCKCKDVEEVRECLIAGIQKRFSKCEERCQNFILNFYMILLLY